MRILVTGGTGTFGRPAVARLVEQGHEVRVLSRRPSPELPAGVQTVRGDLSSDEAVRDAVWHANAVLHAASNTGLGLGRGDVDGTQRLLQIAARGASVTHFLYVSIVGIDRIPLIYYRRKLACERLVAASGIGHTILRHAVPRAAFRCAARRRALADRAVAAIVAVSARSRRRSRRTGGRAPRVRPAGSSTGSRGTRGADRRRDGACLAVAPRPPAPGDRRLLARTGRTRVSIRVQHVSRERVGRAAVGGARRRAFVVLSCGRNAKCMRTRPWTSMRRSCHSTSKCVLTASNSTPISC